METAIVQLHCNHMFILRERVSNVCLTPNEQNSEGDVRFVPDQHA